MVWWFVFSLPLLRRVPEPPVRRGARTTGGPRALAVAWTQLGTTLRELRTYRQAFLMLVAFLLYNDGIQTIVKMATIYGTEIGIGSNALIASILLVQFVGIPCTLLSPSGGAARPNPRLHGAAARGIAALASRAHRDAFLCGHRGWNGAGRWQALSVLFASCARSRSAEFFGSSPC